MNFEKKNRWAVYLAVLGLIGLILSGLAYRANSHFGVAFLEGYGIVFLVEAFFVLKIFLGGMKNSSRFLTKFFRAEMQKIVLFILLIAFLLRYSRPDFFGLLLGLIFALILSRLLMII